MNIVLQQKQPWCNILATLWLMYSSLTIISSRVSEAETRTP